MFSAIGKSLFIARECVSPKLREEMLDYFNKNERPINIALSAKVTTLPVIRDAPVVVEQALFMHPYNLVDEISSRITQDERDAACICFDFKTYELDVCLGRRIDVQIYLNNKEHV